MNPTLRDLYQRVILQHNAQPHGLRPLPEATHSYALHNALCGDQITLRLIVSARQANEPTIVQAAFEGESCALCRASASLLSQQVVGQTTAQALALGHELATFVRQAPSDPAEAEALTARLGDLVALQGVRAFPSRQRCATLPWEALALALRDC